MHGVDEILSTAESIRFDPSTFPISCSLAGTTGARPGCLSSDALDTRCPESRKVNGRSKLHVNCVKSHRNKAEPRNLRDQTSVSFVVSMKYKMSRNNSKNAKSDVSGKAKWSCCI